MTELGTKVDLLHHDFEHASSRDVVNYFKSDPNYGKYYGYDSGVWQNYTLEQHTSMMMRQFDRYFASNFSSSLLTRGQFRVMLALHDIGKPAAVEKHGDEEGRRRQAEETVLMIPEMIKDLDFDDQTKALITAVPTRDVMGSLLKKHTNPEKQAKALAKGRVITPEVAVERLKEIAGEIGVDPKELFELYYMYFLSDAGSYTHDADPKMPPPPDAEHEDLDHLFIFDRKPHQKVGLMKLIPELDEKVSKTRELLTVS